MNRRKQQPTRARRRSPLGRVGAPCEVLAHPATLRRVWREAAELDALSKPAPAPRLSVRLRETLASVLIAVAFAWGALAIADKWLSSPPPRDASLQAQSAL